MGESRAEWEILMLLAERARPEQRPLIHFEDAAAFRIWDHSYAVLASRIFGGLILLQRVEMGRD